jgi:hypothetical protein
MSLTISPNPIKSSCQILCSYANTTTQLQVVQIVNIPGWWFEQVVFPKQRLLFHAPVDAELEVFTSCSGEGFLMKKIPSVDLQVEQCKPC